MAQVPLHYEPHDDVVPGPFREGPFDYHTPLDGRGWRLQEPVVEYGACGRKARPASWHYALSPT